MSQYCHKTYQVSVYNKLVYLCSMKRTIYTQLQQVQMKELYLSGMSALKVAESMGTDNGTCRRELREMGLLTRSKSEIARLRTGIKYVRTEAFDKLTPEAMYWIGFLYADGSIGKTQCEISLSLAETDIDHLGKYNQFLGGYLSIKDVTPKNKNRGLKGRKTWGGRMFRVKVSDKHMYDKLKELGFTTNKTHTITPHILLKFSRDFWRGVVDGDGWITECKRNYDSVNGVINYIYPKIGLCGNEVTIHEFLKFIELSGIECKSAVKKAPKENSLYSMDSSGKPAMDIMNLLYKESIIYLDRKYQKYLDCLRLNT